MVMVHLNRIFPLSALTAGAVFSYYGVYLFNTRNFSWGSAFRGEWVVFAAAVLLWSLVLSVTPSFLRQRSARHIGGLVSAFSAGLLLGAAIGGRLPPTVSLGLPPEQISALEGVVLEDPRALSGGNGMAALTLTRVWGRQTSIGGPRVRSSARGRVMVLFPGGRLEDLKEFGRKSTVYLEGGFISGRSGETGPGLFRASAVHINSPAPPLEQFRTGLRRNLVSRLSRPENRTWGSLALALLLGVRDNLNSALSRSYREAGISHVLALSGMHLAVLSGLIAFLFKPTLGSRGAAMAGALFITGYVFLVGSQPSLDRAAIMYLLGALAIIFSLARNPASLLNLAFLIQIAWRPESGMSVSFMLSYLALWGILHLGLEITGLFRGKIPPALLQGLSASLGAFIVTAPVSAANFGILQPAGILSGLVVVPITTFFMILSMGYLALDPVLPFLARPLGMGLSLLYKTLDRLVGISAGAPGIVLGTPPGSGGLLETVCWLPVLVFSLLLGVLIFFLARWHTLRAGRLSPFP